MNAKRCIILRKGDEQRADRFKVLRGRNWDESVGGEMMNKETGWGEKVREGERGIVKEETKHVEGWERSQLQL